MKIVDIKDLEYELRMLLGADKMVLLFEEKGVGNQVNFFKDSVYLHARCLYSFFYKNRGKLTNGLGFKMNEYESKWMEPLNNFVMHINASGIRSGGGNVQNNTHLNQKTHWFAKDIVRLWSEWIDSTTDQTFKEILKKSLKTAQNDAENDYDGLLSKLEKA